VGAQERTGEVLKELITAVERDVAAMETTVQDFTQERQELLQGWDRTLKAIKQERDDLARENLRVELLVLNAKLNHREIQQVGAYLDTIGRIMPKLRKLKHELRHGGALRLREDLRTYQRKVGTFMSNAANLLHVLRQTGPVSSRHEVATLEATLAGVLRSLESPVLGSPTEMGQLDRILTELNQAYAQFVTVQRLLEQERTALKAENYAAIARLTLIRLGHGMLDTRSISEAASSMRDGIATRVETVHRLRRDSSFAGEREEGRKAPSADAVAEDSAVHHSPHDREALDRMRRGQFSWKD
jgi:chromosome segregation ATPase